MTTQDITELRTIPSMYGAGIVEAYIDGELYRIKVSELLTMLSPVKLKATLAKKYQYLTIDEES